MDEQTALTALMKDEVDKSIGNLVPGIVESSVKETLDAVLQPVVEAAVQAAVPKAVEAAMEAAFGSEAFKTGLVAALGAQIDGRGKATTEHVQGALNQSCIWVLQNVVTQM